MTGNYQAMICNYLSLILYIYIAATIDSWYSFDSSGKPKGFFHIAPYLAGRSTEVVCLSHNWCISPLTSQQLNLKAENEESKRSLFQKYIPNSEFSPKNGGFQYQSPFAGVYFQGRTVSFREGNGFRFHTFVQIARLNLSSSLLMPIKMEWFRPYPNTLEILPMR